MSDLIQLRGNTAAYWASTNPILAAREPVIETDTLQYKIGDGVTAWNNLPYRMLSGEFASGLTLSAMDNPSTPPSGDLRVYAHDVAGRIIPKWVGPSGVDTCVQPALFGNGIIMISPGSSTSVSIIGQTLPTALGTVSHPSMASGVNMPSAVRSTLVTSAATANSSAELRIASACCYRGETFGAIDVGGFFFVNRFAVTTTTANQRAIFGLANTTGAIATTQSPSALTNCIFAGWDSTDTTLQIMHNDATGTCTKINLGAAFPANNVSALYELALFSPPNGSTVGYRVIRLNTGDKASGVLSVDLPTKQTMLTWHAYVNNGGTALASAFSMSRMYLETDF